MNKGILIGIAIAIIIGIGIVSLSDSGNNSEISIIEDVEDEPNQFTVELDESVGFSETP